MDYITATTNLSILIVDIIVGVVEIVISEVICTFICHSSSRFAGSSSGTNKVRSKSRYEFYLLFYVGIVYVCLVLLARFKPLLSKEKKRENHDDIATLPGS